MGGSSGQVVGYRYFTNLLLFIGNPIEKMLGINFDKRGWLSPFVDENGNALAQGVINSPSLFGENEGGVAGVVHVKYGTDNQEVLPFYKDYMESKELQASAYPYQSYLAFTGLGYVNTGNGFIDGAFSTLAGYMNDAFYVGNSGYMKEMLLWPKRTRIRNDGRSQWYEIRSDGAIVCEIGARKTTIGEKIQPDVLINYTDVSVITGTSGIHRTESSGSFLSQNTVSLQSIYDSGDNGSPGATSSVSKSFVSDTELVGIVKFKLGLLKSANTTKIIVPSAIKTKTTSDEMRTYTEYECIFYDGIFEINVEQTADKEAEVGMNLTEISVKFVGAGFEYTDLEMVDINPIHKIREILTDDTAMNKPESAVNNDNFIKAADRIYDEGLGISWSITEKSCIDAINELCYHIESGIRVNRQTGLYEMVLFRDDWFDENEIHTIAENKIKKGSMQYEITNADEVINQVNVNFYDRDNIKNSSFSISESGLIQTLSRVNAETVDFPYFMNMRNAEIVANWKLKILSTGVLKGSFATGWREARKWNRYDLIRLPWSKRWVGTILVRIMSINLGGPTNNEVSIEWVEVVPATGMMNTTIVADDPVNTQPEVPKPCNAKVFELPYFEAVQAFGEREVGIELTDNPEAGYLCAIAEKPQNNSLNAALYADSGNGFERAATVNYCETAYLDQSIERISSSFVVKNVGNIASVRVGSQIFINDETMVYQSYDAATKVLTVKRGALDSIPQNHQENSILYFADDFVAVGQTLYVDGEVVDTKILTTTPSGVLALTDAVNHEVEFDARANRPYPPANVKINGFYWPKITDDELVITWSHRNRKQQTGGAIIGWFENSVTLEDGVECVVEIYAIDQLEQKTLFSSQNVGIAANATFDLSTVNTSAKSIGVLLKTVRDGYECLYPYQHTINLKSSYVDFEINPNEQYAAPNNDEVNFSL